MHKERAENFNEEIIYLRWKSLLRDECHLPKTYILETKTFWEMIGQNRCSEISG